jgi:transcriptional regulator with XRE-family HTH domain
MDRQDESLAAIREAVAGRIRETMAARGISGAELARRLGVSQPTIHAWVNATHGLRRQNIRRLAKEFGVSPAWLEFGADREAEARAGDATELAFLRLYRDLDDEGQAAILRLMTALTRGGKSPP